MTKSQRLSLRVHASVASIKKLVARELDELGPRPTQQQLKEVHDELARLQLRMVRPLVQGQALLEDVSDALFQSGKHVLPRLRKRYKL